MDNHKAYVMKNVHLGDGPMAVTNAQMGVSHQINTVSNLLEGARTLQVDARDRVVRPNFSSGHSRGTVDADRMASMSMNSAATSHHMPASMVSRRAFQSLFRS